MGTNQKKRQQLSPPIDVEQSLFVSWSDEERYLEANGQWTELLTRILSFTSEPDGWRGLSARWQACLARIDALQGRIDRATILIETLKSASNSTLEIQTIRLLAEAAIARRNNKWEPALQLANEAEKLSKKAANPLLQHDAQFAAALALTELGRIFFALDLFQSLRRSSETTPYRRGLAALNEAWILWDTGQPTAIEGILLSVPESFRDRIQIAVSILNGNDELLIERTHKGLRSNTSTLQSEDVQICILLSEWYCVHKLVTQESELEPQWLNRALIRQLDETLDPETRTSIATCQTLLGKKDLGPPQKQTSWRNQADALFHRFLSLLQKDVRQAWDYYRNELTPFLESHRIRTPLMPSPDQILDPRTAWDRKLSRVLQLDSSVSAKNPSTTTLRVGLDSVEYHDGKTTKRVALEKSHVSRKLLMILSGKRGRKIKKHEIHHQLTGSKYNPTLHDSRLHKLLKRLSDKLTTHFGTPCWDLPGDNTVVLKIDIEVGSE